jgi:hypothetical protein
MIERNKIIWRLNVPLKIKIFIWYMKKEVVLTKDNLTRWNWTGSKQCNFCLGDESIQHLFYDCYYARFLWGYLLPHPIFKAKPNARSMCVPRKKFPHIPYRITNITIYNINSCNKIAFKRLRWISRRHDSEKLPQPHRQLIGAIDVSRISSSRDWIIPSTVVFSSLSLWASSLNLLHKASSSVIF